MTNSTLPALRKLFLSPVIIIMIWCCGSGCNKDDTKQLSDNPAPCISFQPGFPAGTTVESQTINLLYELSSIEQPPAATYLEFTNSARLTGSGIAGYYNYLQTLMDIYPHFTATVVVSDSLTPEIYKVIDSLSNYNKANVLRVFVDTAQVYKLFGVPRGCHAMFIIDSTNTVRFFRRGETNANHLRQLVEKFGRRSSDPVPVFKDTLEVLLEIGREVPDLPLISVSTGEYKSLQNVAAGRTICFLFSASCTRCEIKSFLSDLKGIETDLSQIETSNPVCLFEGDLGLDELQGYISKYDIPMPSYILKPLGGETRAYLTKSNAGYHSRVIKWDAAGVIQEHVDFEHYIKQVLLRRN